MLPTRQMMRASVGKETILGGASSVGDGRAHVFGGWLPLAVCLAFPIPPLPPLPLQSPCLQRCCEVRKIPCLLPRLPCLQLGIVRPRSPPCTTTPHVDEIHRVYINNTTRNHNPIYWVPKSDCFLLCRIFPRKQEENRKKIGNNPLPFPEFCAQLTQLATRQKTQHVAQTSTRWDPFSWTHTAQKIKINTLTRATFWSRQHGIQEMHVNFL